MTLPDIPWPAKGDKAFLADPTANFDLAWVGIFGRENAYVDSFKTAADELAERAINSHNSYERLSLVIPLCYLYRHYFELQLKRLLELSIETGMSDMTSEKLSGTHSLCTLWNKAKDVLKQAWPDGSEADLLAVESVILEFHNADPSGQEFRFSTLKSGEKSLAKVPTSFCLENLVSTINSVAAFFDGSATGLCAYADYQRDQAGYYGD